MGATSANLGSATDALEEIIGGAGDDSPAAAETGKAGGEEEGKSPAPAPADETEDEPAGGTKTTVLSDEQIAVSKEIGKIDAQLEALDDKQIDETEFYDALEDHLSEAEAELEISDKAQYHRVVSEKLAAWKAEQGGSEQKEALLARKKELEGVYDVQAGIVSVTEKHPGYNHEKVQGFFLEELSRKDQNEIMDGAKSYAEVYARAYAKYIEAHPEDVASEAAPTVPDVNSSPRKPAEPSTVKDAFVDDNEKLRDALGI